MYVPTALDMAPFVGDASGARHGQAHGQAKRKLGGDNGDTEMPSGRH